MTNELFHTAKAALLKAAKENSHPFRYFTMATTGINNSPRLRTVVLRDVKDDLTISFYTDKRSKKVTHIRENNNVGLLFFDYSQMLQLKVDGIAYLEQDEKLIKKAWKQTKTEAKKDYTTDMAPGTKIKDPEMIERLESVNYFSIVHIIPKKIEYLQLKKTEHLRALFSREDDSWEGSFLVP
ncbi:pyridoxamine 5'-phosphate oxidase family protein [Galbibacter sp. EGI 63066]|uniref:pyridoxamine 5'-phosphate oxidase family protein n=1 Tax=Galbibacter sp. EGI 63066 TaxID=2993559 RepID=UPI002249425F|nr:pyridoxamine 5'-phosphate oxidase family protein [Galbibacter sp. EGI 63066]MCX2678422.1 pyridoxamine 5'-phosphate oxidase family protein [Galbibacter sp. EGI 63066]